MIFQQSTFQDGSLQQREVWDSVALTYTVFNGAGAQVSQRPLTAPEQTDIAARVAAATADTNSKSMTAKATSALAANNTYIALASPSAAQNTAQIKLLSKECNALIRLLLGRLEADDA